MALSLDYDYHAIIVAYIFYIFYDIFQYQNMKDLMLKLKETLTMNIHHEIEKLFGWLLSANALRVENVFEKNS